MKNSNRIFNSVFKKPYLSLTSVSFIVSLALMTASCNNQKPEDTKDVATEHNQAKFGANENDSVHTNENDAKFLVDAAEINLEEIQLGQLAQSNSSMTEVKDLGKMMETEHASALKDLQALAAKKQISLPASLTNDGQDAYKKLNDKKGMDFDKKYCDMMVKGHKDAIDKFEKASTDATDADIKTWATSMLPALRNHLDHSMMCQKNCEKMK